jgi:hypothetical protein
MNFSSVGVVDNVAIGYDAIRVDKEAAAPRELFAFRVEGFNRNCRRFDAANQLRE